MIREMKVSDWDDMMVIFQQNLEKGYVTFRTERPSYEDWDAGHIKECRLVYEQDGRVVGYTMLAPTSARECYRGVAELSIYVHDDYTGQGIGTKLLKTLMEEAEKSGYWTLVAVVLENNQDSFRLHTYCGFRVVGIREKIAKDRFGNWQSTMLMEWRNSII